MDVLYLTEAQKTKLEAVVLHDGLPAESSNTG
jgi:hypothetical protein